MATEKVLDVQPLLFRIPRCQRPASLVAMTARVVLEAQLRACEPPHPVAHDEVTGEMPSPLLDLGHQVCQPLRCCVVHGLWRAPLVVHAARGRLSTGRSTSCLTGRAARGRLTTGRSTSCLSCLAARGRLFLSHVEAHAIQHDLHCRKLLVHRPAPGTELDPSMGLVGCTPVSGVADDGKNSLPIEAASWCRTRDLAVLQLVLPPGTAPFPPLPPEAGPIPPLPPEAGPHADIAPAKPRRRSHAELLNVSRTKNANRHTHTCTQTHSLTMFQTPHMQTQNTYTYTHPPQSNTTICTSRHRHHICFQSLQLCHFFYPRKQGFPCLRSYAFSSLRESRVFHFRNFSFSSEKRVPIFATMPCVAANSQPIILNS